MSEQVINLESSLQTYKNNLKFAEKTNSKQRKKKYQNLIRETEAKILKLGISNSVQINADLREKIDKLSQGINELQDAKDMVENELNEKIEILDKALKPKVEPKVEAELIPTEQPVILIDEAEAEAKAEKISCPKCGKLVKGIRGLRAHESQWCKGGIENHE